MSIRRSRVAAHLLIAAGLLAGVTACGSDDAGSSATDAGGSSPSTDASQSADTAGDTTGASGTDNGQDSSGSCTEERKGGTVTLSEPLFPRGLDPLVNLGSAVAGGNEITAIYDTLLRFNPDTGDYDPQLAEAIEPNDDLTQWTLTLRDGPTFGDGTPVDADAVKASIERMRDSTTNSGGLANLIAEIEVVDPLTVVFHLDKPWGTFPYVLAEENGMIVNPAVFNSISADELAKNPPPAAGAGPYVAERFAEGEEVVLKAKDDYWGGPVCIDELRFVSVSGGQATYQAFQAGESDMAMITDWQVQSEAAADGVGGYGTEAGMGTMVMFNNGRTPAPTQDPKVREAISLALDLDTLNERAFGGDAVVGSSLMPDGSPVFGGPGPQYDPDRAAELVTELKADGFDSTLRLVGNDSPEATELVIAITAMLNNAGFDVDAQNLPRADANRVYIDEGSYDLAVTGPVMFEETTVVDLTQFRSGASSNRTGYANDDMDAALDQMQAAQTREETKAAMEQVQSVWNETFPAADMIMANWWWAINPKIKGIVWTRDVVPMFQDAYLAE